jgi:hypothetical protein
LLAAAADLRWVAELEDIDLLLPLSSLVVIAAQKVLLSLLQQQTMLLQLVLEVPLVELTLVLLVVMV